MHLQWKYEIDNVDWEELSNLYKIAPLGDKNAKDLEIVFNNSMYKCFVYDNDTIIGVGRALAEGVDTSCFCDVAIFKNRQNILKRGLVSEHKEK